MPELPLLLDGKPFRHMSELIIAIMLTPGDIASAITHVNADLGIASTLRNQIMTRHSKRADGGLACRERIFDCYAP
jgi:hypothetical protein